MKTKRKLNNIPRKEPIIKLRKKGKSYNEIQKILGCSKSTIAYHCDGGKEKARVLAQSKKRRAICRKVSGFKSRCSKANFKRFRSKLKTFKRRTSGTKNGNKSHGLVNSIKENYSCEDVINKIGKNPICYLTGLKINLDKPETYNLDHIIPTSHGGSNDLSNLAICLKDANMAKGVLKLEDLYELCENILSWKKEQEKSS